MTDTDATRSGTPVFPPGRYGRRREPARRGAGRRRVLIFAVAGAFAGLVLAIALYQRYGAADYRPQVLNFTVADNHVTLRFSVYKSSGGPALCHVRARDRDGVEVGAADVPVPAGTSATVTYTLATSGPPVTAEVPACRAR